MVILNSFSTQDILIIARQIHNIILTDSNLTNRSLDEITKLLKKNSFYVYLNRNVVCGFLSRERLIGNYYEVKSWYVTPTYRNTGLADTIFKKATEDPSKFYIGVTFNLTITNKVKKFNFHQIAMTNLPLKVLVAYIASRSLTSIFKHLFINKSYLLLKS